jgi:hypothetical protein
MPGWVSLELTNLTKGVTLTKNISDNWYTHLGYKETDIYGLQVQTASVNVWYEKQWKYMNWFIEAGFSKSGVISADKTTSQYTWAHITGGIVWNNISPVAWLETHLYSTMKIWAQFWKGTWDGSDVKWLWSAIAGKADIDVGIVWKTDSIDFGIGARRTLTPREMQAPLTSGLGWYTTLHGKLGIQGNLWSTHLYGSTSIERGPISQEVWVNWGFNKDQWSGNISFNKQKASNTLVSNTSSIGTRIAYKLDRASTVFIEHSQQKIWNLDPVKRTTIGFQSSF